MENQDLKKLYITLFNSTEALSEYVQALGVDYKKVKRESHAWNAITTRARMRDFTNELGLELCRGE